MAEEEQVFRRVLVDLEGLGLQFEVQSAEEYLNHSSAVSACIAGEVRRRALSFCESCMVT
jgi:hypothetical protein